MKIGIGLIAALALAVLAPSAATAADKPDKAAEAALAKGRTAGMAEAPAVVQAKGLACTVTDAIFLGESEAKGADGKNVKSKVYEVACSEGLGYILGNPTPDPFDCLIMSTAAEQNKDAKNKSGGLVCKLPANKDPKTGLAPLFQKLSTTCTITQARSVGQNTADKLNIYEAACSEGPVYLLSVPLRGSTSTLKVDNCLKANAGDCKYLTSEVRIASFAALAAKSGRACDISDGRYVATKNAGGDFFEIGCKDGKSGYMVETDPKGAFSRAIACAQAENVAGGCTLTQVETAASTDDAALYSRKAKEIGFACTVSKYRSLGLDSAGMELAELACSDRPDGAFAQIPVNPGQKGGAFNCVRAEAHNQNCKLTPKSAVFEKLHNQLENKGKACVVSATRGIGQTADGNDVVEISCTGSTGVVATFYKDSDGIGLLTPCAQAQLVGGCKLP